jgi:hypothetical protein
MTVEGGGGGDDKTGIEPLNTAVFAPMPSASMSVAVSVKPGRSMSPRNACRKSASQTTWSLQLQVDSLIG